MNLQPGDWVRLRKDEDYDTQPWEAIGQVEVVSEDTSRALIRFGDDLIWKSPIDLIFVGRAKVT